jgi:hypothetical protein
MTGTEFLHYLRESLWLEIIGDLLDYDALKHHIDEMSATGLTSIQGSSPTLSLIANPTIQRRARRIRKVWLNG